MEIRLVQNNIEKSQVALQGLQKKSPRLKSFHLTNRRMTLGPWEEFDVVQDEYGKSSWLLLKADNQRLLFSSECIGQTIPECKALFLRKMADGRKESNSWNNFWNLKRTVNLLDDPSLFLAVLLWFNSTSSASIDLRQSFLWPFENIDELFLKTFEDFSIDS